MGVRQEFRCEGCGAAAVVSGGPDGGSFGSSITVGCRNCGRLDDLATVRFGETVVRDDDPLPPCRDCGSSDAMVTWSYGEGCPKCGGRVEKTGRGVMLWN